jgi:hypothetical protein
MDPRDIRRWAENHRVAAARELAEQRGKPLSPQQAWELAMDLLCLDESRNGDPFTRHDPVTQREDGEMWEAWATLRSRWGRGR